MKVINHILKNRYSRSGFLIGLLSATAFLFFRFIQNNWKRKITDHIKTILLEKTESFVDLQGLIERYTEDFYENIVVRNLYDIPTSFFYNAYLGEVRLDLLEFYEDKLLISFLLSTDFYNSQKKIEYLYFYDPYASPCYRPNLSSDPE